MTICKLFATKLLDTPWLLHLDVFGSQLGAVLRGRSRPDVVGQSGGDQWVAFESKGRVSPPDDTAKTNAKRQAQRCVQVNETRMSLPLHSATIRLAMSKASRRACLRVERK